MCDETSKNTHISFASLMYMYIYLFPALFEMSTEGCRIQYNTMTMRVFLSWDFSLPALLFWLNYLTLWAYILLWT